MLSIVGKKFSTTLLVMAFVLTQLFCVCAKTAASPQAQAQSRATKSHECCEGKAQSDRSGSGHKPASSNHDHDPKCPHCNGPGGSSIVIERSETSVPAAQLLTGLLADPMAFARLLLVDADARLHSLPHWQTEHLYPPPDILRVKCTLQI